MLRVQTVQTADSLRPSHAGTPALSLPPQLLATTAAGQVANLFGSLWQPARLVNHLLRDKLRSTIMHTFHSQLGKLFTFAPQVSLRPETLSPLAQKFVMVYSIRMQGLLHFNFLGVFCHGFTLTNRKPCRWWSKVETGINPPVCPAFV